MNVLFSNILSTCMSAIWGKWCHIEQFIRNPVKYFPNCVFPWFIRMVQLWWVLVGLQLPPVTFQQLNSVHQFHSMPSTSLSFSSRNVRSELLCLPMIIDQSLKTCNLPCTLHSYIGIMILVMIDELSKPCWNNDFHFFCRRSNFLDILEVPLVRLVMTKVSAEAKERMDQRKKKTESLEDKQMKRYFRSLKRKERRENQNVKI